MSKEKLIKQIESVSCFQDLLGIPILSLKDIYGDYSLRNIISDSGGVSIINPEAVHLYYPISGDSNRLAFFTLNNYKRIMLDYVSVRESSDIEFSEYLESRKLNTGTQSKTGKAIQKFFQFNSQDNLRNCVEIINSKTGKYTFTFKPVSYSYDKDNMICSGTLGASCMNNKFDIVNFYHLNKVGSLCMFNTEGKIVGRAIAWKTSIFTTENDEENIFQKAEYFIDRIYTTEESALHAFIEHVESSNYIRKTNQTYHSSDKTFFTFQGKQYEDITIITNLIYDYYIPYMDTMTYFTDGEFHNNYNHSYNYELTDTGGNEDAINPMICYICGYAVDHGDEVLCEDEIYCSNCFHDNFSHCNYCGDYVHHNCGSYIDSTEEFVCDYHRDRHFTECYECGEFVLDDYSHTTHDGRSICDNCLDDYVCCEECGELFHIDDTHNENDYLFCQDCHDELYYECHECGEFILNEEIVEYNNVKMCDNCRDNLLEETPDTLINLINEVVL